jgi:DNA-binding response OmpR family regulator
MHALIIEDEPYIAILIEDHLRALGYTSFAFAVTEAEAVAEARKRCPDLITADMRLPQGCGVGAVQTICGQSRIPVVFITGTGWEVLERVSDAIVVRKPIVAEELDRAVAAAGIATFAGIRPGEPGVG